MSKNPLLAIDFYKADHRRQYPVGTTKVYSSFTPRTFKRYKGDSDKVVVFGVQMFIKDYLKSWKKYFFNKPQHKVVKKYKKFMDSTLGKDSIPVDHIKALHNLGYLPIQIKALPEGTLAPAKIPVVSITNTHPDFFWLVNYLETAMSAELWKPMTNATIAYDYRRIFEKYADLTGASKDFIPFQGHDFSARGLSGIEDQFKTQISHLLSFVGTDTCLAIEGARKFYNADYTTQLVGTSVPATEHSTMSSGIEVIKHSLDVTGKWVTPANKSLSTDMLQFDSSHTNTQRLAEIAYVWYLITEVYPTGVISIVADTFDFWYMMEFGIKVLKPVIESRKPNSLGLAKVVFRPDSGNPVDVICGVKINQSFPTLTLAEATEQTYMGSSYISCKEGYFKVIDESTFKLLSETQIKGAIECLWDVFGGTTNGKGYKTLSPCVGLIYGDSITLERQDTILKKLADKKFASDNIVLGQGSYTYQMNTRDSLGFAMKATYCEVAGKPYNIYKDPATDDGTKKSPKGLLQVKEIDGNLMLSDQCTWSEEQDSLLQTVYCNGEIIKETSLQEIRERLWQ